jgi:hypothetical protein
MIEISWFFWTMNLLLPGELCARGNVMAGCMEVFLYRLIKIMMNSAPVAAVPSE